VQPGNAVGERNKIKGKERKKHFLAPHHCRKLNPYIAR